jgi:hypothetical protein
MDCFVKSTDSSRGILNVKLIDGEVLDMLATRDEFSKAFGVCATSASLATTLASMPASTSSSSITSPPPPPPSSSSSRPSFGDDEHHSVVALARLQLRQVMQTAFRREQNAMQARIAAFIQQENESYDEFCKTSADTLSSIVGILSTHHTSDLKPLDDADDAFITYGQLHQSDNEHGHEHDENSIPIAMSIPSSAASSHVTTPLVGPHSLSHGAFPSLHPGTMSMPVSFGVQSHHRTDRTVSSRLVPNNQDDLAHPLMDSQFARDIPGTEAYRRRSRSVSFSSVDEAVAATEAELEASPHTVHTGIETDTDPQIDDVFSADLVAIAGAGAGAGAGVGAGASVEDGDEDGILFRFHEHVPDTATEHFVPEPAPLKDLATDAPWLYELEQEKLRKQEQRKQRKQPPPPPGPPPPSTRRAMMMMSSSNRRQQKDSSNHQFSILSSSVPVRIARPTHMNHAYVRPKLDDLSLVDETKDNRDQRRGSGSGSGSDSDSIIGMDVDSGHTLQQDPDDKRSEAEIDWHVPTTSKRYAFTPLQ